MENDASKQQGAVPPYLSYKTFSSFMDIMRRGIPNRIDRSLMAEMSGSTRSHLMATMRYLELITPKGTPSPKLSRLVNAEGSERKKVLREILLSSYPFLFRGFDVQKATGREIEEKFVAVGASGDTVRRCVAFFISAAQEAQIPLSPFLKAVRRKKKGISGRRRSSGDLTGELTANGRRADPSQVEWNRLLLSKFPTFDPAWPDEIKSKWFDAFARLKDRRDPS